MLQIQLTMKLELRERVNLHPGSMITYILNKEPEVGEYVEIITTAGSKRGEHYRVSPKSQITIPNRVMDHLNCDYEHEVFISDKLIPGKLVLVKDLYLQIKDAMKINPGSIFDTPIELQNCYNQKSSNEKKKPDVILDSPDFMNLIRLFSNLKKEYECTNDVVYVDKYKFKIKLIKLDFIQKGFMCFEFSRLDPQFIRNKKLQELWRFTPFRLDEQYVYYFNHISEKIEKEEVPEGTLSDFHRFVRINAHKYDKVRKTYQNTNECLVFLYTGQLVIIENYDAGDRSPINIQP